MPADGTGAADNEGSGNIGKSPLFLTACLLKWGAQREAQGKRPKDYKIFAVRLVRNCIGQDDRSWTHMHRAASHIAVAKLVSASVRALCAYRCLNCDNLYALHEAGSS
jgi:hypothetical protein